MGLAFRHPAIGETVGDYKIEEFLGAGGLGVVFKVKRRERFFAMKFLLVPKLDGRTRREIAILVQLNNQCVVRYVGSDYWPDPTIGHPYIVMEYVPGDTLEAFALKQNPSARKSVRIILDAARTLGEVHAAGVFHRDVKPENILIRGASERPILIDFGIGAFAGASCLTGTSLPPGTDEFRSPEPLRFQRENADSTAHYEYGPSDELWSLGVTFYWLLTDVLPFGERTDEGGMEGLHERILNQRPIAPHLVNPRVPLAVSNLCMKMLAEWPADRYPNVPQLCTALQETLTQAEDDAAWDVPLVDTNNPQLATTLEDPVLREPNELTRQRRRWEKQTRRRGKTPPREAPLLFPLPAQGEHPLALLLESDLDLIPPVDAPEETAPPREHKTPANASTVAMSQGSEAPLARLNPSMRRLGLVVAVLTMAAVGLSMRVGMVRLGTSSHASQEPLELPLPSTSPIRGATGGSVAGHEVAPIPKALEASLGEGAAPVGAPPPAPTAHTMLPPAQTTKNEMPKPQTQRAGLRLPVKSASVAAAAIASCTLVEGCTSSTPQVRPGPPAITCSEGWKKTHEKFSINPFVYEMVRMKGYEGEPGELARVKDGPAILQVGIPGFGNDWSLPVGTLLLGAWQLGDNRLFGTFTEAKIPGGGTFPVCFVVRLEGETAYSDEHDNEFVCSKGVGTCLAPESKPGDARAGTRVLLKVPTQQP